MAFHSSKVVDRLVSRLFKAKNLFCFNSNRIYDGISMVETFTLFLKNSIHFALTVKSQFVARNLLNTANITMDFNYFVDFNR